MNSEKEKKIDNLASQIKEKLFDAKKLLNEHRDITPILSDIWNLSKEKFVLEVEFKELKKYKGIIFTVGFSKEPIILNILANSPDCVYFIYTKESEHILDSIIEESSLKPTQYKRELISRVSAADSYDLVKKGLKFITEEKNLKKETIALDPTGGTKIMSVGCGIAASIFNIDILYVNNTKYNPTLRRPEPGTELLINIPNPFDIYQDDKIIEGLNYLKDFNFVYAKDIFYNIKSTSKSPLFPELLACIADILYYWEMIDYTNALKSIDKSKKIIQKISKKISPIKERLIEILYSWREYMIKIIEQIKIGETEVEKISPLLIYDIKSNADREFFNSNYNGAALKYYRTIEMINQYILLINYNVNTQNPDWEKLPEKTKQILLEKEANYEKSIKNIILIQYNEIWKYIFDKISLKKTFQETNLLPERLGLVGGIIIRNILGDSSIDKNFIFHVITTIENRNKSIFAHGISSITKKVCENLKNIAEKTMKMIEFDEVLKSKIFNKKNLENLIDLFIQTI